MEYTAVIRTLGTAGEKYQQELDSLCNQTIPPKDIIVYIAEGYPIPKETCGKERYVYVKKGMVAQRALPYDEVTTEWVLFLDDDVYLPPKGVEHLFAQMKDYGADVISPNTFQNQNLGGKVKFLNIFLGKAIPFESDRWMYKVLRTGGFKYNSNPTDDFYWSQSNAGPCFLCRKADYLNAHFEDELWLDDAPYALPEDQVMFYKMHLNGLKVGTSMNSGIIHLDAGSAVQWAPDKIEKMLYSEVKNMIIFWHRFIKPNNKGLKGIWSKICINHYLMVRKLFAARAYLLGNEGQLVVVKKAIKDAVSYVKKNG